MNIGSREFYDDISKLRDFFEDNNHNAHRDTLKRVLLRYEELRAHACSIATGHGTSVDFRDALESNTDEKTRTIITNLERWQAESEEQIAALQSQLVEARKALESLKKWRDPESVSGSGDYDKGLMCGIEDRDLQKDGYEAMRYGYDAALDRVAEEID